MRAQLQRLLTHPDFSATPQRCAFLSYVVEEYLAGRGDLIKGVSIAMSVFGRDETFDQQVDPIVRMEARRLRQDIDGYYAGPGRDDPLRLSIPKGGYTPRFERVTPAEQATPAPEALHVKPLAPKRFVFAGLGVVAVAALSALMWGLVVGSSASDRSRPEKMLPQGPVMAVLPFETLGDGPSFFAEGITQQLTSELARFRDLWVLPLGSGQRQAQSGTDLQSLRSEFNAEFALEGSVVDKGDRILLSARLIDLNNQRYIWVNDYSVGSAPKEIYAAQDEIIRDVIGKLAGKYGVLTQNAMRIAARTPPSNRDAYDCVLSYYSYQISIDLARHPTIMNCIQRSLEQSPDYAEAWAVLSNLYLQQIRFGLSGDRQEIIAAAEAASRRAVELDPSLAAGHLMQANARFVRGDIEGFRKAGHVAVGLSPNDGAILAHFGMRLAFSGAWDEGLALVDRAIAFNPVHPHWYHFPRVFYEFDQGNYQRALAVLDQIDMPNFLWTPLWSAALHANLGQMEEAQASLNELLRQQPNFAAQADSILAIWQLGERFEQKLLGSLQLAGLVFEDS
ncbi:hypothetical protein TRL7639_03270 [Falsiruegeria litorea R37]|uniref:Adenylate cyclase n=2 Tax=Falsiruegeria litorea TaxID=1280831 RepID=A0A1Y5T9W5_9RHOB|nr:hypothetical protein TRL7639_03270 [Falsiruegeria litorea R37]